MDFDNFLNAYVMTMPTMLTVLGIGIVMAATAGALNAITPAGMVDIEDVDDPDGTDNARQQLHERRLILVGGVVLILTSLIGTIALQLTTLQEFLGDRKSTRLNSSHVSISSAVFSSK